ncbi:hypothetical protein A3B51_00410 [Candidatus Curtissbacteria bacterium RIFCSPLOWO2_01_FULL_41_18]|uniref:Aspartyl/glutamyl-tRNA(Asn/Gln) amidotransferase subunit C n=1 Tax=Candidatus Curtissbacteria bacterium RIFCSPLOWO2_01_FULL_41_18 TaxID=1797727 RepID=A0A1F5HKU9_9BACT|nr:MAG: hypothetical protein A3B51_00410 [Candidatus Curtissbacteria bacterium RIFCSPLOWO2_01_FULL_41_18]
MQKSKIKNQKSKIDINHTAKLANLSLSPAEKKTFEKQLGSVLAYISKLNEVNTKNVEAIGQITGLVNVVREDKTAPSIPQEDALKNAPRTHNGFFEVDAIFEENGPE